MLYKLLIVDDEEIIRDGLSTMVEWGKLGFEIVRCLSDGKEAIFYIENNPVDVILTDIKMTFVTGLELAEYVYRNKPGIKVVIISGYKEFEFAKQAINFNVVHYILKPTRIPELNQVFEDIRKKFQNEQEEKDQFEKERQQFIEMIPMLQEEFFTDLMLGAVRKKSEISEKIKLLNFSKDFDKKRCYILKAQLIDFEKYLEDTWEYGKPGFFNAIRNMFKADNDMHYFSINCGDGRILILAVEQCESHSSNSEVLNAKMQNVIMTVEKVLGINMEIEMCRSFESIYEIDGRSFKDYLLQDNKHHSSPINSENLKGIFEKQKLLLAHITEGNIDAVESIFETLFEDMINLDITIIRNSLIELFSLLGSKLKSIDIDVYMANNEILDYNQIMNLSEISEMKKWGRNILNIIVSYVSSKKVKYGNRLIEKAKEYICDNYNKDISLDDVADHVYLSTVYLCRFFKQVTGENFIDYLSKVRMEKAIVFLKSPKYKVYEISPMVGYKSTKYFSNIFRKYTGLNPSEYRKKCIEEGESSNE